MQDRTSGKKPDTQNVTQAASLNGEQEAKSQLKSCCQASEGSALLQAQTLLVTIVLLGKVSSW